MKISVTLPNYNHGHYIRDNLDGLLAQTYENWELHVVDDGSTDESAKIIAEYATRDARIKPVYFEKNQGTEAALECSIQAADGELLYCTAADDYICNPHFFEIAVGAFQNTPAAVFSGDLLIHNIPSDEKSVIKRFVPEGFLNPQESMDTFFKLHLPVHGHAAIMNRQMVLDLGNVKELKSHIDGFWITALAAQKGSFYSPEVVVISRDGIGNYSRLSFEKQCEGYALREKRLKTIVPHNLQNNHLWDKWRKLLIILYVEQIIQVEITLLDQIKQYINTVPFANIDNFGSNICRVFNIFESYNEVAQADANELTHKGMQIFNKIAGPLEEPCS